MKNTVINVSYILRNIYLLEIVLNIFLMKKEEKQFLIEELLFFFSSMHFM